MTTGPLTLIDVIHRVEALAKQVQEAAGEVRETKGARETLMVLLRRAEALGRYLWDVEAGHVHKEDLGVAWRSIQSGPLAEVSALVVATEWAIVDPWGDVVGDACDRWWAAAYAAVSVSERLQAWAWSPPLPDEDGNSGAEVEAVAGA